MQRLEAELKECEAVLPPTVREVYLRTVRQKGQDALAAVERDQAAHKTKTTPSAAAATPKCR